MDSGSRRVDSFERGEVAGACGLAGLALPGRRHRTVMLHDPQRRVGTRAVSTPRPMARSTRLAVTTAAHDRTFAMPVACALFLTSSSTMY